MLIAHKHSQLSINCHGTNYYAYIHAKGQSIVTDYEFFYLIVSRFLDKKLKLIKHRCFYDLISRHPLPFSNGIK